MPLLISKWRDPSKHRDIVLCLINVVHGREDGDEAIERYAEFVGKRYGVDASRLEQPRGPWGQVNEQTSVKGLHDHDWFVVRPGDFVVLAPLDDIVIPIQVVDWQ